MICVNNGRRDRVLFLWTLGLKIFTVYIPPPGTALVGPRRPTREKGRKSGNKTFLGRIFVFLTLLRSPLRLLTQISLPISFFVLIYHIILIHCSRKQNRIQVIKTTSNDEFI